jgi:hypothetical protein
MEAAFAALGKKLVITVVDSGSFGSASLTADKRRRAPATRPVHAGVMARQARQVTQGGSSLTTSRRIATKKAVKKR